jgi:hypothetical protein
MKTQEVVMVVLLIMILTVGTLKSRPEFGELFAPKLVCRPVRSDAYEHLLEPPLTRRERERSAVRWWGCVLWNSVPCSIRKAMTTNEFRRKFEQKPYEAFIPQGLFTRHRRLNY